MREHGEAALAGFEQAYPELAGISTRYEPATLDLDAALDGADLVLVHEWNDHALVAAIGAAPRSDGLVPAALPRHAPPRR